MTDPIFLADLVETTESWTWGASPRKSPENFCRVKTTDRTTEQELCSQSEFSVNKTIKKKHLHDLEKKWLLSVVLWSFSFYISYVYNDGHLKFVLIGNFQFCSNQQQRGQECSTAPRGLPWVRRHCKTNRTK